MHEIVTSTLGFTGFALFLALAILFVRRMLVPSIAVPITINGKQTINAQFAQTLLEGLSDNDIHLPSACAGAGTCGLCRVQLDDANASLNPIEQALLNSVEIESGQRLACQHVLRRPTNIALPDSVLDTRVWQARIISSRALSPLIREIQLESETEVFDFTPGFFMQVTAPASTVMLHDIKQDEPHKQFWNNLGVQNMGVSSDTAQTRAYSLANRPTDDHCVTLMIRLALPPESSVSDIPPGYVSSWLFTRVPGDIVEISGPHQGFHIQDEERELVFVGGGVGMAPLRSMIHQQILRKHPLPMTFFYGARSEIDLLYSDEFNELSRAENGFNWTPALSEPGNNWQGESGFVHSVFKRLFLDNHQSIESCDFYLCGPPLMIKATVDVLKKAGVSDNHIFKDEFG